MTTGRSQWTRPRRRRQGLRLVSQHSILSFFPAFSSGHFPTLCHILFFLLFTCTPLSQLTLGVGLNDGEPPSVGLGLETSDSALRRVQYPPGCKTWPQAAATTAGAFGAAFADIAGHDVGNLDNETIFSVRRQEQPRWASVPVPR